MSNEYDDKELTKIKSIEFSLVNPKELLKYSVCNINNTNLYEKNSPCFNSLFDTRMGIVEQIYLCITCGKDYSLCPGHFGHIELCRKIYLPYYLKVIVKLLQIVCLKCSKLPPFDHSFVKKIKNHSRFVYLYNTCKDIQTCLHCGFMKPKITRNNLFIIKNKNNENEKIYPDECFEILKKISDEDCNLLGFNIQRSRPEWMIISLLPVCPPCVRPTIIHDGGIRTECDLTYKYIDIIKANNALQQEFLKFDLEKKKFSGTALEEFIKKKEKIIEDRFLHLQINITTLMNNKLSNILISQNKNNKPFKCFTERLSGKHGRIRGNLLGKRVDFSARSVISPDSSLGIEELGVPYDIAKKLTICEIVNKFNIEKLQKMVYNGEEYPGATYIIRDKITYSIKILLKNIELYDKLKLKLNDKVERHLIDGDYVLFNRQPSLHKFSTQGHRVRVLKYQTFRINPNIVNAYNADF